MFFLFFSAPTETSFADWSDNEVKKGNDEIVLETRAALLAPIWAGDAWHDQGSLEPPVMMGKDHFWSFLKLLKDHFCLVAVPRAPSGSQRNLELLVSPKFVPFPNEQLHLLFFAMQTKQRGIFVSGGSTGKAGAGLCHTLSVPAPPAQTQTNSLLFFKKIPANVTFSILLFPSLGWSPPGNSGSSLEGQRTLKEKKYNNNWEVFVLFGFSALLRPCWVLVPG